MTAPRRTSEPPRLVSVVLCARDEERWIGAQVDALASQTYRGAWELIVVDDGSRDRTRAVAESRRAALPGLRITSTTERRYGLNAARNIGTEASRGDLVAFCDADDVADPEWLGGLVRAAPGADIVGGPLDHRRLNDGPLVRAWRPERVNDRLLTEGDFLPYAPGGNCAMRPAVARAVRWDESFRFEGSDLDFCWRAQLAGYSIGFAPDAVVHRRFRDRPTMLAQQYFRYGKAGPRLYRRYRQHGMRATDRGEVLTAWRWLLDQAPGLAAPERRGDWVRKAAMRVGRIAGSIRHRVVYL